MTKECDSTHCKKKATTKVIIKPLKSLETEHELCPECADELVMTHAGIKDRAPHWRKK